MTLSRRSFLGRGLALVGGAVAAAKLGGAPRRAEAVSTTADLAAPQEAEGDAHPLYSVDLRGYLWPSGALPDTPETEETIRVLLGLTDEVSGTGRPYTHTFTPVPRMRGWYRPTAPRPRQSDLTANYSDLIADYGVQARPRFDRTTLSEPSPRRHTRLLFAEPRHVKRRG